MAIIKEESKSFPLWFQDETANANQSSEYLRCLANIKEVASDNTYTEVSAGFLDSYWGSVLAPNGTDIYFCPYTASTIGKIDTLTDTTSSFGSATGYAGGVLAPNGFIYFIPSGATAIIKLDPSDDTFITFGSFVGSLKWMGGVCTPDGIIYCATENSTTILKIDTNNDTTSLIGAGIDKYWAPCIAPNGKIYFAPLNKPTVLVLDPSDDSTSTIAISVNVGWTGAVLAPNGCIYSFPREHTNGALKIDTNLGSTSLIAGIGSATTVTQAAHMGSDGFIYALPYWNNPPIVALNPDDDSFITIGVGNFAGKSWMGASLPKNGIIYGTPLVGGTILKIGTERATNKNLGLSTFNNKG